jgi:hypothetical protein
MMLREELVAVVGVACVALSAQVAAAQEGRGLSGVDCEEDPLACVSGPPDVEAFRRRLDAMRGAPLASSDATVSLWAELARRDAPAEYRAAVVAIWRTFFERNAEVWCATPPERRTPFVADLYTFDAGGWPDAVVDANGGQVWLFPDGDEDFESCGNWRIRELTTNQDHPVAHYVEPWISPSGPHGSQDGNCGVAGDLLGPPGNGWEGWHAAWDRFEQRHRSTAWLHVAPFLFHEDPNVDRPSRNPNAEFKIINLTEETVRLMWRGFSVLEAQLEGMSHGLKPESRAARADDEPEVEHDRILTAYYGGQSVLLESTNFKYSNADNVRMITSTFAPVPVVLCRAGTAPYLRWPTWAGGTPETVPPLAGELPPAPDLAEVERRMAEARDIPGGAPEEASAAVAMAAEIARVDEALRRGEHLAFAKALTRLGRGRLSRRFASLPDLVRGLQLETYRAYLQERLESELELERELYRTPAQIEADERERQVEHAKIMAKEVAEMKRREAQLLGTLPAVNRRCLQGYKDWLAAREQLSRAALAGQPAAVRAAAARRDAAGEAICEAVQHLERAMATYRGRGLGPAADAIQREYRDCLRNCR